MVNILPTFLDHVLFPTMKDRYRFQTYHPFSSVFTTEIYHLDSDGKHQGVVYNEMKARENTEMDLLDLALRRLLFLNSTTYSVESGGKTSEIKNLENQECIDFHKQFYNHDQVMSFTPNHVDNCRYYRAY
jgi:Zn-dependent M16 (insulinase) family peptidase